MSKSIIIDVETASLYGEVIELAYAELHGELDLGQVFAQRFTPSKRLDPRAVAVHRIHSPRGLPSAVAKTQVPAADYWIGHNVIYDWERLGRPPGVKLVCTMTLAKLLWPTCETYRLSALYLQLFGVSEKTVGDIEHLHSAKTDVTLCYRVLMRAIKESRTTDISQLPTMSHPDDWSNNGL